MMMFLLIVFCIFHACEDTIDSSAATGSLQCRGIRHEGAFSQSESKSGPSARCKPCERLYRGVISKGFNLDWLKQHLQDGSIRQSHPDLFKATKHGRPVTTCMSPDADVAWSGDKLEPEREKEANPKKRTFDQVAAGAGPSELHGGQQHDADMGTTQGMLTIPSFTSLVRL